MQRLVALQEREKAGAVERDVIRMYVVVYNHAMQREMYQSGMHFPTQYIHLVCTVHMGQLMDLN